MARAPSASLLSRSVGGLLLRIPEHVPAVAVRARGHHARGATGAAARAERRRSCAARAARAGGDRRARALAARAVRARLGARAALPRLVTRRDLRSPGRR